MAVKTGVTITKDNLKKVTLAMANLTKKRVLVGIPATNTERKPENNESTQLTNAALGYIHNYGAPEANIPARPFMEPGIKDAQSRIETALASASKAALSFDADGTTQALDKAGLIAQSSIRNKINEGPFEPLAPSTIKARQRRGVSRTKPLIDTGQLRNSITYVIKDENK